MDIINKLRCTTTLSTWSIDEKKQILEVYHIICKKESQLFDLIFQYHGCDSWEDIFRDYDPVYLDDKAKGVEIALDALAHTE